MALGHKGLSALIIAAVLAILVAVLGVFPVAADSSMNSWRYFKPIQVSTDLSQDSLVEVVPDSEVHANAAIPLSDLRIIDTESQLEVPYKLLVERGELRRASVAVSMHNLGQVLGEYTSFVLDLQNEGVLHNELVIRTPSRNFQRDVVVEGSRDKDSWDVLSDDGKIFDFTIADLNFNARDTRVHYPSNTARYLRVRITNDQEEPLEVTGAMAFFSRQLPPRTTELEATITRREEDAEHRKTLLYLDIGTQGFPTQSIRISTSVKNFYRQVTLEGSHDSNYWSTVQNSEELYSYNTSKFVGDKLSLGYPEIRFRYFRLTILNEDNLPLPITSAHTEGVLRKLVFSAEPGGAYRLYYGNEAARSPSYELERIFPFLVTENLPQVKLGDQTINPTFAEPLDPLTERYPWLFPLVVSLAALVIGLFLTSLLRQVRRMLPPPTQTS